MIIMKSSIKYLMTVLVTAVSVTPTVGLPNFIVMQPDDLEFFEDWTPPAHFDSSNVIDYPPASVLPNMNLLRSNGVQMMQAYTASPKCGTSRYSTITGRYASRSAYGRDKSAADGISTVVIPKTKLTDENSVDDGNDCSFSNAAALFKANGYATGVSGKWHLSPSGGNSVYDYAAIQAEIQSCGFDFAEAIYHENVDGTWAGDVTHNMEHVTAKAIEFILDSINVQQKPFFLYFNPTVPHASADVTDALASADCRETVEGYLSEEPDIPFGMTADYANCAEYRQTVLDRGGDDDKQAGAVWVDDSIGSLMETLASLGELDNTFFLFQQDHGQEGKGAIFETGARIAQFVHYPNEIPAGTVFDGVVSTIDILPTMMDFAGIDETSAGYYPMDGKSWKDEVVTQNLDWSEDTCVYVEIAKDRAIRCGCHKYLRINDLADNADTQSIAEKERFEYSTDNYYYLCDDTGAYISSPDSNPERVGTVFPGNQDVVNELSAIMDCYLSFTDPSKTPDYDLTCTNTIVSSGTAATAEPTIECPVCTRKGGLDGNYLHIYENGVCSDRCTEAEVVNIRRFDGWLCGACPDTTICNICTTADGETGIDMTKTFNSVCQDECVHTGARTMMEAEGWSCGTCSAT